MKLRHRFPILLITNLLIVCVLTACNEEEPFSAEEQAIADRELILEFIADNNLDAIEHPSGLFYVIEQQGNILFPDSTSEVTVNYEGKFLDGNIFQSTYSSGSPVIIDLADPRVIKGWKIGIPLMKKGAIGKLLIPSELGFGRLRSGDIPPNSVLFFDRLELIDID